MGIKVGCEKLLFSLILCYHLIYIFLAVMIPSFCNKFTLLFFIVIYIYYNTKVANLKKFLATNFLMIFYVFYIAFSYGIRQVYHSDFYSIALLMIIYATFSEKKVLERFENFLYNNIRRYTVFSFLVFFLLVISVLFQNGLRIGYGSNVPILYGPFQTAHVLGYLLMGMFCAFALYCRNTNKLKYFILKYLCVVLIIWTGARSAMLATAVLVLFDFLILKGVNKKILLTIGGIIILLYLAFFTDVLTNNPIVSKTISAMEHTGTVTNNRSLFVSISMGHFLKETDAIDKIFGIGMENVRINFLNKGYGGIHIHNEYLNALVGYGVLGFVIYIVMQLKLLKISSNKLFSYTLQLVLFLLAYFNGLGMYTSLTPCLAIIICLFRSNSTNEKDVRR